MVDLDNDPTKLIEIVEIGKRLLMTRGTLTTFSIANDVAKYFPIVPCAIHSFHSFVAGSQHHAPAFARKRNPVGYHLQCRHHSAAHSAGTSRCGPTSPSVLRLCCVGTCSSTVSAV